MKKEGVSGCHFQTRLHQQGPPFGLIVGANRKFWGPTEREQIEQRLTLTHPRWQQHPVCDRHHAIDASEVGLERRLNPNGFFF